MATSPDAVRADLAVVMGAAAADTAASAVGDTPSEVRGALFSAAPLVAGYYSTGAAALAVEWFEEIREESGVTAVFEPFLVDLLDEDEIAAMVAETTKALRGVEIEQRRELEQLERATLESVTLLTDAIEQRVADAYRETMLANVREDPAAQGWKRFAQPGACKFCLMLAARGAVYTESTARFAAHGAVMRGERKGGNCKCIAGPEFGSPETWAEAEPMQYVASRRDRTAEESAALRDYLNQNFPDAPG